MSARAVDMATRQFDIKGKGIAIGHTALIESGERGVPTVHTVALIAEVLNVSVDWLVTGKEPEVSVIRNVADIVGMATPKCRNGE